MKKPLLIVLLLSIILPGFAQKKDKIKGDKEVVTINEDIAESFNQIELGDNLNISLKYSDNNSYVLTADRNLIDVIEIKVVDSVLRIYTSKKIVSSKKLDMFLTVNKFDKLTLRNDIKLNSENEIEADSLVIHTYNSSRFEMDINTSKLNLNMYDNSDGKLLIKSGYSQVVMNDRSDLKGDIVSDSIHVNLNGSSEFKMAGETESAVFNLKGTSNLKADNMKATTAELFTSNKSDVHVFATKLLKVYAKGKSDVYVYGNPEVEIKGLTEKSRIIKK
jgi:hypothetical protein